MLTTRLGEALALAGLMTLFSPAGFGQNTTGSAASIRVPDRPQKALFEGKQGPQRTEIYYNPDSQVVTVKLLVQDSNGYFIPNIRRENFVVYEDGVRQSGATVDIEHAPVSLGVLVECGGHYPALSKHVVEQGSMAARDLLDVLGAEDRIAVWTYADAPNQLADFSQPRDSLGSRLLDVKAPGVSETNLYDALLFAFGQMGAVSGRKAIIAISSGIDTFSKASFEDVMATGRHGNTPVYTISLAPGLRQDAETRESVNPLAGFDWKGAEGKLQAISSASGGRLYSLQTSVDLPAIYDDIMENLKVRYVIRWKSSTHDGNPTTSHSVGVELVNPGNGRPLEITDTKGRRVSASVVLQGSYTPATALPGDHK